MKKIILITIATLSFFSCQKDDTKINNTQNNVVDSTFLINPPKALQGNFYDTNRNGKLRIVITKNDVIRDKESFTQKYKNHGLKESFGNEYTLTTKFKVSPMLDDNDGFSMRIWSDSFLIFKELKYGGRTTIYKRK